MNLRLRLTLIYTGLMAGAFLALGASLHVLFARSLWQQLDARLSGQTLGIAGLLQREVADQTVEENPPHLPDAATLALRPEERHLAQELGEETTLTRDLSLQLRDPAGRVVYRSGSVGPSLPVPALVSAARTPAFASVADPALGPLRRCALAVPLRGHVYFLVTATSLAPAGRAIETLHRLLLLAVPLMLAVIGVAGFALADRALRPVARITAAARAIRSGDLTRRIGITGPRDELQVLADTFDEMIASLEHLMTAQRQFLADASHELRTPLTVILSALEVAVRAPEAGARVPVEGLVMLRDAARRMKRLVDDLMLLARADLGEQALMPEPVDLRSLVREVGESARWIMEGRRLHLDLDGAAIVMADPDRLRQLLLNLLDNAAKHTRRDGEIGVSLRSRNGSAVVAVADNGDGIAPEHLPHIFERFYRADGARRRERGGTGLGLAIGRWIAEAHGGTLTAASELGRGTTFFLTLPLDSS